ncbi:hypothetical protein EDB85DRAFT_1898341 [Lactarius pseudohatsudake]|nr:hypothetical protein EDB85DRAFT_1898341 [Lactarius pseudohatsudake]
MHVMYWRIRSAGGRGTTLGLGLVSDQFLDPAPLAWSFLSTSTRMSLNWGHMDPGRLDPQTGSASNLKIKKLRVQSRPAWLLPVNARCWYRVLSVAAARELESHTGV